MKTFLIGFITMSALFALSMILAYLISLVREKSTKKTASPSSDANVFYITNFEKKKRAKRKKSHTPDIALKGSIIRPDQFHKYVIKDANNQSSYEYDS